MPETIEADIGLALQCAQATPGGRRLLAKQSLYYKAARYLDVQMFACQRRWHERLKDQGRAILITGPGQGKTELVARFMVFDAITEDRDIRVLLLSETEELAKKSLSVLQQDLENTAVVADYGVFKSRRFPWGKLHFTVRRKKVLKDYTVEAAGIGSNITGSRFDLIILDDIISQQSVRNPERRRYAREYFENTVYTRLEPWGRLLGMMTRWHVDDIVAYFIKHPDIMVLVEKTLGREPEDWDVVELPEPELDEFGKESRFRVTIGEGDPGECVNPERWPVPRLLKQRKIIGSFAFNLQYQCEAQDDTSALIKRAWLEAAKCEQLSYDDYNREDYIAVIGGADPALVLDRKSAEERDTDYTVILSLGILPNEHVDVIGLFRDRGLTPVEIETAFKNEFRKHQPDIMLVEVNSFGIIIHWNLKQKTGIPVAKHHTGKQKYDPYQGYSSLSVVFENSQIRLPYRTEEDKRKTDALINEIYNPEETQHDDQLSALWIAYSGVRRWLRIHGKTTSMRAAEQREEQQQGGVKVFSGRG